MIQIECSAALLEQFAETEDAQTASEDGTAKPLVLWNRRLTLELLQSEVSDMLAITTEPTTAETSNTANE